MSISILHLCIGLHYTFTIKYFAISILNGSVAQSGQGADFFKHKPPKPEFVGSKPIGPAFLYYSRNKIGNPYMSKKFIRFTLT